MQTVNANEEVKNYLVVKSNDIIQHSRYSLTYYEEKIITYLISFLNTHDADFQMIEFNIQDFCRACGISTTSGKNYAVVRSAIQNLGSRVLWIDSIDEQGREVEVMAHWIAEAMLVKNSGLVRIRFDDKLKPYLLQQERGFTSYERIFALHLDNEYALRLYNYCKSVHYNKTEIYEQYVPIEELKVRIDAAKLTPQGKYEDTVFKNFAKFKERALDVAVRKINELTDINVSYTPVKEGRRVAGILLKIATKDTSERLMLVAKLNDPGIVDAEKVPPDAPTEDEET